MSDSSSFPYHCALFTVVSITILPFFQPGNLSGSTTTPCACRTKAEEHQQDSMKQCSVWGNVSHITNQLCQEQAWVFGKLSLLKFQIYMIDVGPFFARSMKPGCFHRCRGSCQFLGQWWSHLHQAEWEPLCGVVICSADTHAATAALRSILI